jgi:hypothetical protein
MRAALWRVLFGICCVLGRVVARVHDHTHVVRKVRHGI